VTLTVADIDRWSVEAVRAVFHAADARGQATLDASRQLSTLSVFDTWEGATAEARKHMNAAIRQDLDAHGYEALAVARAADQAADGIEHVQAYLRTLRHDADELHMRIDAMTNTVVPTADCLPAEALIGEIQLQPRLDAILAEANAVDAELAAAINMADGNAPIPADAGPPIGPQGLTPTQRESDANQERAREEKAKLEAHVKDLQQQAKQAEHDPSRLQDINSQLAAAQYRMGEFNAIDNALRRAPETYLTVLDIPADPNHKIRAAVAVGNPDTASDISVTVPGLGSSTKDSLPGMVSEARNLQQTAEEELRRLGRSGSVVTIAWMGYDPPANPIKTDSPRDLWRTMTDDRARGGAAALAPYLQQLHTTNPSAHLSLFGHSYGSLTASLALQQLNSEGLHPVNDAVFYGSPGLELQSADQLGLANGHAYVMRAVGEDPIPELAPLAPLHGWGADPYLGMMPELSSHAGVSPDGVPREGVHAHADYPRAVSGPGGEQQLRMSGYNLAIVAAGIADLPDGAEKLVMAPTPLNPHPHPGR
jgi:alpha/beta hydrolase family protein